MLAHATTPSSASPVSISQQQQSLRHERILHMRKEAFRQLRIQLEYEQMVLFEQLKHLEGRGWSPSSSPSSSSLEDKESVFASAMVAAERVDAGSTADDLTQLLKHVDISENQLLLEFEQQTQRVHTSSIREHIVLPFYS